MIENIFWTAYSNDERHSSITSIKKIIAKYGDIVDFKLFSDITLNMTIEIEEYKIDKLYEELKSTLGIDKFELLNSTSKIERTIYLNVTFNKSTGNMIVEVPSVPG